MVTRLVALFASAALLAFGFTSFPAMAVPVVDQQSVGTLTVTISATPTNLIGQSFTAGLTGPLTQVDIQGLSGTGYVSVTLRLFATTSGLPTGSALASEVVSEATITSSSGNISVNFANPTTVTAGTQYALVFVPQTGLLNLSLVDPGLYADGQTLDNGPSFWAPVSGSNPDMAFATYVDSPSVESGIPNPVMQQFGKPTTGTCNAAQPPGLNWSGVPSGGCTESWAQWVSGGTGGAVCTRTLVYSAAQSRWVIE